MYNKYIFLLSKATFTQGLISLFFFTDLIFFLCILSQDDDALFFSTKSGKRPVIDNQLINNSDPLSRN